MRCADSHEVNRGLDAVTTLHPGRVHAACTAPQPGGPRGASRPFSPREDELCCLMIRVGFDISLVEVRYRHYTKQIKPRCAAFDEGRF